MKNKFEVPPNVLKKSLQFGRYFLALGILFFLCKHLFGLFQDIKVESISFNPLWLLTSYAILIVHRIARVFPWLTFYQCATSRPVSFLSCWSLLHLSEPGKYLPGKVGQFVSMAALCCSLEISRDEAITSTLLHLAFKCLLGCLIGVPFLLSLESREFLLSIRTNFWDNTFRSSAIILVIISIGAVLFILFRNRLSSKIPHLQKLIPAIFSFKKLFLLIVTHFLLWGCIGVSFFFS